MKPSLRAQAALVGLWFSLENAHAVQIEPMGKALLNLLKTPKVQQKKTQVEGADVEVYYVKDGSKVTRAAFIEKGIYEPNCTHTWAIGIDGRTGKVLQVRPIEMSCPHALPTKTDAFLGQYVGKGPADAAKLDAKIQTIAKATGSSQLATAAVKRAIKNYVKLHKTL